MRIGFYSDLVLNDNMIIDEVIEQKLLSTDFNCANLESPLYSGKKKSAKVGICLFSKAKDIAFLKKYRFTTVNIANNHMMDFSVPGLVETITKLKEGNIGYFGAGINEQEAQKPYIIRSSNETIALWGFSWKYTGSVEARRKKAGISGISINKIKEILEPYKEIENKIAYFHFGTEFEDYPEPYLKRLVEELLDEGYLDLIIGNHPHCIQGVFEKKENGNIKRCFYSLGNFILPEEEYHKGKLKYPPKSNLGFGIIYDTNTKEFEYVPYQIINQGREVKHSDKIELQQLLHTYSEPLKLQYKEYKKFYKINRYGKKRPMFVYSDSLNKLIVFPFLAKIYTRYAFVSCCKFLLNSFGFKVVDRKVVRK